MEISGQISRYLATIGQLNEYLGDWRKDEVEIITDPNKIVECQRVVRDRCLKNGQPEEWGTIGILSEDQYVIHLRDAVYFPPNRKKGQTEPNFGSYIRIVYRGALQQNLGISLFVLDESGRIILNRAFRHAPRSWCLEAAGTIAKPGETREDAVRRCIRDEFGSREVLKMEVLTNDYVPERGLVGGTVPIYLIRVSNQAGGDIHDLTVAGHSAFTAEQFLSALRAGEYTEDGRRYLFCDGYTNTGFLLAQLRKAI